MGYKALVYKLYATWWTFFPLVPSLFTLSYRKLLQRQCANFLHCSRKKLNAPLLSNSKILSTVIVTFMPPGVGRGGGNRSRELLAWLAIYDEGRGAVKVARKKKALQGSQQIRELS